MSLTAVESSSAVLAARCRVHLAAVNVSTDTRSRCSAKCKSSTLSQLSENSCRKSQNYYKVHIRENYIAHNDETEPSRIAEIVDKAYKDADWIAQKVHTKTSSFQIHKLGQHRIS